MDKVCSETIKFVVEGRNDFVDLGRFLRDEDSIVEIKSCETDMVIFKISNLFNDNEYLVSLLDENMIDYPGFKYLNYNLKRVLNDIDNSSKIIKKRINEYSLGYRVLFNVLDLVDKIRGNDNDIKSILDKKINSSIKKKLLEFSDEQIGKYDDFSMKSNNVKAPSFEDFVRNNADKIRKVNNTTGGKKEGVPYIDVDSVLNGGTSNSDVVKTFVYRK